MSTYTNRCYQEPMSAYTNKLSFGVLSRHIKPLSQRTGSRIDWAAVMITNGIANHDDVAMNVSREAIARQTLYKVSSQYYPNVAASAGRTETCSAGTVVY